MSYIIDIIIILVVLLFVFLSAKKGFVRSIVEVVGFIAAIIIAFTFSSPIADIVYDKMVEPTVVKNVESVVVDVANETDTAIDTVWGKMPDFITENNYYSISKEKVTSDIQVHSENSTNSLAKNISLSLVKPVTTRILTGVISIVMVTVLLFIVRFVAKPINKLFTFSVVGDINKVLGGLLGLVKGLAIVIVFCLIISLILSFSKNGFLFFTNDIIEDTILFKYIMEFLPFL